MTLRLLVLEIPCEQVLHKCESRILGYGWLALTLLGSLLHCMTVTHMKPSLFIKPFNSASNMILSWQANKFIAFVPLVAIVALLSTNAISLLHFNHSYLLAR